MLGSLVPSLRPVPALGSALAVATAALITPGARSDTVMIPALKDNTLIETVDGSLSNGQGDGIYCGLTGFMGAFTIRRALIAFDVAAEIPAGSTIDGATLTLWLIQSGLNGEQTCSLHRVQTDWGEGESNFGGGLGAPAEPGDATWLHTFFPDDFWASPGGDFDPAASASALVPTSFEAVNWTSAQLAADVQGWLDDPAGNFGWVVVGNETEGNTAKKFGSRETVPEVTPMLTIDFTPPGGCAGDTDDSGEVDVDDLVNVILDWDCEDPPGPCLADVNGDGIVNVDDLVEVILAWGPCP